MARCQHYPGQRRTPPQPARFTATPQRWPALTSNCQEFEVPPADSALQRADDRARIVIGARDIERLAILTESDAAWARPRPEMPLGGSEIRMRLKAQLTRVRNGTEHHLAGQLDRRLKRIAVVSREKVADEPPQTKIVHDLRAESVFHPQTVNVGEIAADRDLAVPVLASDQHRDQAISPRRR